MKNTILTILLFVLVSLTAKSQSDAFSRLEEIAIIEQKVMMPMRDGIRLATDIYRPKTDKKVPVIFSRTPYNFNSWRDGKESVRTYQRAYEAVKRGYAYVVQNERGRFFSEGEWDILGTPLTDGYDAFSWMKDQTWSNGKIGTLGCSSTAEWQMAVAALDHPSHAAMIPQGFGAGVGTVGRYYEQGNWYRGGAEQMLFFAWLYGVQHDPKAPRLEQGIARVDLLRLQKFYDMAPEYPPVNWSEKLWHLPLKDLIVNVDGPKGIFEEMITRKPNDPKWFQGGLYHEEMKIDVPAFWFASWYDVSTGPNIELYKHVSKDRDDQYLVIAPTLHCRYTRATENTIVGERSVGDARLDYDALVYGWFDYWLKEEKNDILETPKVQYYLMGKNEWKSSDVFPPESAEMTTFYLSSNGRANSLYGDGMLVDEIPSEANSDLFVYDPMNPVTSYGGNVCCTGNAVEGGAFDQQQMETRNDILVYTSPPLEKGIEVSGFIEATLFVSSDAKDTDFTIKLIDVYPDGKAYNLDETIQRARYREGYEKEVFMEDGKVYKINMSPMTTSNFFEKGHRIRIEISSSNFPRFARNLNTGGNNYDESEGIIARNTIHHSKDHPSMIKLPIVKSVGE